MNKKYIITGMCVVLVSIVLGISYKIYEEVEYRKVFNKEKLLNESIKISGDTEINDDWLQEETVIYDNENVIIYTRKEQVIVKFNYKRGKVKWMMGENIRGQSNMKLKHLSPIGENFQWFSPQHELSILPDLDNINYTMDVLLFDTSTAHGHEEEVLVSSKEVENVIHYRINERTMTVEKIEGCGNLE